MIVSELWRFPVKSMGGEQLASCDVGEFGLTGDRSFGVVDVATGKVLTGRREPRLLFASASLASGGLVITVPGGATIERSEELAAWLDRDVRLEAAGAVGGVYETPIDFEHDADWVEWQGPAGAWHDSARSRVSLVSRATLGEWDRRRFRANIVLDGDGEDGLVGHEVTIGSVRLSVEKPIDRCVMVTRPQPGIDADLSVLRRINRERGSNLAVGALVREPGRIAEGDQLCDRGAIAPATDAL